MTQIQQRLNHTDIETFYFNAKHYCENNGFEHELQWCRDIKFSDIDAMEFLISFAWVVINSGMKNQVAVKIYEKWCKEGNKTINHEGKRKAIEFVEKHRYEILAELRKADDKLAVLKDLAWIGDITKYHLARNIGLDYAKPDRHLIRLVEIYGFNDVQAMCEYLAQLDNERIGVIDVVLWRYCNMTGNYISENRSK